MTQLNKKQISEALREAMNKEDPHTRAAAQKLNLNPCYISMALNPKSWDAMGKSAWIRLEEWHNTRGTLAQFEIPEGEEIWKPKEKLIRPVGFIAATEKPLPIKLEKVSEKLPDKVVYSDDYIASLKTSISARDQIIKKQEKEIEELVCLTKIEKTDLPCVTNDIRQKMSLDIEINLIVNGQRIQL